jgi:hypothetical protein
MSPSWYEIDKGLDLVGFTVHHRPATLTDGREVVSLPCHRRATFPDLLHVATSILGHGCAPAFTACCLFGVFHGFTCWGWGSIARLVSAFMTRERFARSQGWKRRTIAGSRYHWAFVIGGKVLVCIASPYRLGEGFTALPFFFARFAGLYPFNMRALRAAIFSGVSVYPLYIIAPFGYKYGIIYLE